MLYGAICISAVFRSSKRACPCLQCLSRHAPKPLIMRHRLNFGASSVAAFALVRRLSWTPFLPILIGSSSLSTALLHLEAVAFLRAYIAAFRSNQPFFGIRAVRIPGFVRFQHISLLGFGLIINTEPSVPGIGLPCF